MNIQVRNQKDFWTGLLFITFGIVFLAISPSYTIGSPSRIGPGFFPFILSSLLVFVGLAASIRGLRIQRIKHVDSPIGEFAFRPLILVTLAIIVFGLIIDRAGAFEAIIITTLVASYSSKTCDLKSRLILAFILAGFSVLVFVWGLGMPVPIFSQLIFS